MNRAQRRHQRGAAIPHSPLAHQIAAGLRQHATQQKIRAVLTAEEQTVYPEGENTTLVQAGDTTVRVQVPMAEYLMRRWDHGYETTEVMGENVDAPLILPEDIEL